MKNYTVFYIGDNEHRNMAYSFPAIDDDAALEFCKFKLSVSTDVMTIVENDTDGASNTGRLVYNHGAFIKQIK